MAKFAALPLYTDAFIADTIHLNATQTGAYIMLLMTAWRTPDCRLPDDDKILARYARMDLRSWKANKDLVMSFWKKDDEQKWYQARLVDERNYADHVRSKNVAAGKASALKRHETPSTVVQPNVNETSTPKTLPKTLPNKEDIYTAEFEQFWADYPKREGGNSKKPALKKYIAARKDGIEAEWIISGAKAYAAYCRASGIEKTKYVAEPSTWLYQERWNNEYQAAKKESQIDKLRRQTIGYVDPSKAGT